MCGICGILHLDDTGSLDSQTLKEMCRVLTHRGPDDEGFYVETHFGMGMRRLSIIDLSGGHQPIHNEGETVWVVSNGEIYNFPELRKDLERDGHAFYTKTDTEVIVHLYEEVGENCVDKLNGMFAFALWDTQRRKLMLVRDRIGIKPLYYAFLRNQMIFASELKGLLRHPKVIREVDVDALDKYLTYEYVPCPHTMIKNVKKLPPGHMMVCENGRTVVKQYYDLRFSPKRYYNDTTECIEALLDLLKKSVRRRLISDVPLGVFLSGGIDSSAITALASQILEEVKTFSIAFEDRSFDESEYAREVAHILQSDHYEQTLTPRELLNIVPKVPDIIDEPLGDASIIPTYLVSKFAREHVTVVLGGDGGDELFAGYPTYQAHRLARMYESIPPFVRWGIDKVITSLPVSDDNFSLDFKLKKFISGIGLSPEIRNYVWLGSFSSDAKQDLLAEPIRENLRSEWHREIEDYIKDNTFSGMFDMIQYLDMKLYLQEDILVKLDRASMANSLEARVPFLDHEVVEFVNALPWQMKLHNLTTKYILKKSVKEILPQKIIRRKKKGFGIPVAKWVKSELKELVLDLFAEEKIKKEGFFNYSYVHRLLEDHFQNKKDNRKLIWTLLVFQLWYSRYIDGRG